jgi:hypothetical protein
MARAARQPTPRPTRVVFVASSSATSGSIAELPSRAAGAGR